jgi:sterol desaturase/sphingolipid hydroxylase (fatty acid hydroxylase superfamily)
MARRGCWESADNAALSPAMQRLSEIAALDNPLAWKGVAVTLWLVLLFTAERLYPADDRPRPEIANAWRRLARNFALFLVNIALSPVAVVPLSLWAAAHAIAWRPLWWRGAFGLALDLVLLDLWIYWWHRANHEVPLLWRFHAMHHLDRVLDTSTALRFHFGEVLLSAAARAITIVLLGLPVVSVVVFETLVLAGAIFHHSNLALPPRFEAVLSRIVVTPSIHWVHHHRARRDTDANYSTLLSLWDRLFASRSPTARMTGMAIGVEGSEELALPQLVIAPFR